MEQIIQFCIPVRSRTKLANMFAAIILVQKSCAAVSASLMWTERRGREIRLAGQTIDALQ